MTVSTVIWIIVAVIIVGAIVAFVMSRSGARRAEAERSKAAEIREKASEHDRLLRESEANAAEARARSEMARVEAEKRQLDAERLTMEAENRSGSAEAIREKRDEQLRLADLRDPDVRTDQDGYRVDEHGNRLHGDELDRQDMNPTERPIDSSAPDSEPAPVDVDDRPEPRPETRAETRPDARQGRVGVDRHPAVDERTDRDF
jgi:hypothetical protein